MMIAMNVRKALRARGKWQTRRWLIPAMLALGTLALPQNQPADLRGIYIYTNDVSQITPSNASQLSTSFSVPGVDGVAVVIGWNAIEPSMGQYQWTTLDDWIGQ